MTIRPAANDSRTLKLYSVGLSPFSARVRAAVYFKNLTVEMLAPPAALHSSEFLSINPIGKLPALVLQDGTVLPESDTIVEYLEDAFPAQPLRPRDAKDRARVRLMARIVTCYIDAPMFLLFPQLATPERDAALVHMQLQRVDAGLTLLSQYLGTGGYAFGSSLTTADCCVFPTVYLVQIIGSSFDRPDIVAQHPRIAEYYRRAQEDPVLARVLKEMSEGLKAAGHS